MTTYNRKLQSALIAAGKKVEANLKEPTPSVPEIELLHDKFLQAVDKDDQQRQSSTELIAALLKYQIENL